MRIVIDTNILVNAFVEKKRTYISVVYGLLLSPSLTNKLCFDIENTIKQEYEANVGNRVSFKKWYLRIRKEKKVCITSHELDQRHRQYLSQCGCHEHTKHSFLGAAFNSDKIFISDAECFGKGTNGNIQPYIDALRYLQDVMNMKVLDAEETMDELLAALNPAQIHDQLALPSPARTLRVFLCCSSSNKPVAGSVHKFLTEKRIEAWLDTINLIPGQNREFEISQAIQNSDAVIILLSEQTSTIEEYVQKEIKIALDESDKKPDGTIFIIPARLDECKIPERLVKFQWVDFFENNWKEKLIKSLKTRADSLGIEIEAGETEIANN